MGRHRRDGGGTSRDRDAVVSVPEPPDRDPALGVAFGDRRCTRYSRKRVPSLSIIIDFSLLSSERDDPSPRNVTGRHEVGVQSSGRANRQPRSNRDRSVPSSARMRPERRQWSTVVASRSGRESGYRSKRSIRHEHRTADDGRGLSSPVSPSQSGVFRIKPTVRRYAALFGCPSRLRDPCRPPVADFRGDTRPIRKQF